MLPSRVERGGSCGCSCCCCWRLCPIVVFVMVLATTAIPPHCCCGDATHPRQSIVFPSAGLLLVCGPWCVCFAAIKATAWLVVRSRVAPTSRRRSSISTFSRTFLPPSPSILTTTVASSPCPTCSNGLCVVNRNFVVSTVAAVVAGATCAVQRSTTRSSSRCCCCCS